MQFKMLNSYPTISEEASSNIRGGSNDGFWTGVGYVIGAFWGASEGAAKLRRKHRRYFGTK